MPDFIALSSDAETVDAAKTIARVLWDDLNFEHEFALIPRDTYATIPRRPRCATVPFDRWRELNADGVIVGTVQKTDTGVRVEVRLFNVRSRQSAFAAGVQRGRWPTSGCTRTRSPTRFTSSSARCAAWRAPS